MQLPYFDSSWFIAHRDCSISAVNRFAIAVPEWDQLKTPRKQAISTAYRFISVYKQRKRAARSQKTEGTSQIPKGLYEIQGIADAGRA
jgi:hypothetical protein